MTTREWIAAADAYMKKHYAVTLEDVGLDTEVGELGGAVSELWVRMRAGDETPAQWCEEFADKHGLARVGSEDWTGPLEEEAWSLLTEWMS